MKSGFNPRIHLKASVHPSCTTVTSSTLLRTLKQKWRHFDEIFITGCTGSCHFDNFQCSQWWTFHQNEDFSVSVKNNTTILLILHDIAEQMSLPPVTPYRVMEYAWSTLVQGWRVAYSALSHSLNPRGRTIGWTNVSKIDMKTQWFFFFKMHFLPNITVTS